MKVLTLVLLFSLILCTSTFQASGALEISGGNKGVVIIGQGTAGTAPTNLDIGRTPSKTDYRNPIPYRSPPVSIPPPPPPTPPTPDEESAFGYILTPRNQSRTFTAVSDVHGTGRFSIWSLAKDPLDMAAMHSSSGMNGQLDLTSSFTYVAEMPTYYTINSQASGSNSTILTLDASIPTLMIQQNSLRFAGSYYNEKNQYENNRDAIRNYFSAIAIRKNSTYISGLDRLLQSVNVTGSKTYRYPALYNKSTFYSMDTRFVGDYGFDAQFSQNNASAGRAEMSEKYQGMISLNQRMLSQSTFIRPLINDSSQACYDHDPLENECSDGRCLYS